MPRHISNFVRATLVTQVLATQHQESTKPSLESAQVLTEKNAFHIPTAGAAGMICSGVLGASDGATDIAPGDDGGRGGAGAIGGGAGAATGTG